MSVDLLCGTTAAELHNTVYLLCDTTAAELHNSVDLLCDTKTAELNPVWCMHQESHTFSDKTVTNHAEKYEGLIQSKIQQQTSKRWTLWKMQQTQIDVRFTKIQQTF